MAEENLEKQNKREVSRENITYELYLGVVILLAIFSFVFAFIFLGESLGLKEECLHNTRAMYKISIYHTLSIVLFAVGIVLIIIATGHELSKKKNAGKK